MGTTIVGSRRIAVWAILDRNNQVCQHGGSPVVIPYAQKDFAASLCAAMASRAREVLYVQLLKLDEYDLSHLDAMRVDYQLAPLTPRERGGKC